MYLNGHKFSFVFNLFSGVQFQFFCLFKTVFFSLFISLGFSIRFSLARIFRNKKKSARWINIRFSWQHEYRIASCFSKWFYVLNSTARIQTHTKNNHPNRIRMKNMHVIMEMWIVAINNIKSSASEIMSNSINQPYSIRSSCSNGSHTIRFAISRISTGYKLYWIVNGWQSA